MLGFSPLGVQALGAIEAEAPVVTTTAIQAAQAYAVRSLIASARASTPIAAGHFGVRSTIKAS